MGLRPLTLKDHNLSQNQELIAQLTGPPRCPISSFLVGKKKMHLVLSGVTHRFLSSELPPPMGPDTFLPSQEYIREVCTW